MLDICFYDALYFFFKSSPYLERSNSRGPVESHLFESDDGVNCSECCADSHGLAVSHMDQSSQRSEALNVDVCWYSSHGWGKWHVCLFLYMCVLGVFVGVFIFIGGFP